MSGSGSAWDLLGIEPTADLRAIRRAYSRKLKAIDVDADPAAFIALREAFAAAQADVPRPVLVGEEATPEPVVEADPEEPAPTTSANPDADAEALARLLYGEYVEHRPSPEQAAAMLGHWRAVVADPRMQQVGHYGDVERWASVLIANTMPFSSPLVVPAVMRFGWRRQAGSIHQSPAVAFLVAQSVPLGFANDVQRPGHPFNAAWRELTAPSEAGIKPRKGNVSPIDVHKLASKVVREHPELYERFNPERLSLWGIAPRQYLQDVTDGRSVGTAVGYAWLIWVGYLLVAVVMAAIGKAISG